MFVTVPHWHPNSIGGQKAHGEDFQAIMLFDPNLVVDWKEKEGEDTEGFYATVDGSVTIVGALPTSDVCVRIYRVYRERSANPRYSPRNQAASSSDGTGAHDSAMRLGPYLSDDLVIGDTEGRIKEENCVVFYDQSLRTDQVVGYLSKEGCTYSYEPGEVIETADEQRAIANGFADRKWSGKGFRCPSCKALCFAGQTFCANSPCSSIFLFEDPISRVIYSPICNAFHALAKKTIPQAAVNVTFTSQPQPRSLTTVESSTGVLFPDFAGKALRFATFGR
jgi:hypothetical protein